MVDEEISSLWWYVTRYDKLICGTLYNEMTWYATLYDVCSGIIQCIIICGCCLVRGMLCIKGVVRCMKRYVWCSTLWYKMWGMIYSTLYVMLCYMIRCVVVVCCMLRDVV